MTRIISGRLRGKIIKAPGNLPVRPTTDFAKEALFNILNNRFYFDEISFLDLFAGTGNISFEIASRGCTNITCVDENAAASKFIQKTADQLQFEGLTAVRSTAEQYLAKAYKNFDLIFADPPYEYEDYEALVEQVFFKKILTEEGVLIVEHQKFTDLSHIEGFSEMRKYGNVAFSFFEQPTEED